MAGPEFVNWGTGLFFAAAVVIFVLGLANKIKFKTALISALGLAAIATIIAFVVGNSGDSGGGGGGGGSDPFCRFDPCYCCSEPGGQYSYDCNPECTSAGVLGSQPVSLSICDERARTGAINENCVIFE